MMKIASRRSRVMIALAAALVLAGSAAEARVGREQVEALPLQGRSLAAVSLYTPGASVDALATEEAKHGAAKRFGERRRVRGPRHEGLVGAE